MLYHEPQEVAFFKKNKNYLTEATFFKKQVIFGAKSVITKMVLKKNLSLQFSSNFLHLKTH